MKLSKLRNGKPGTVKYYKVPRGTARALRRHGMGRKRTGAQEAA